MEKMDRKSPGRSKYQTKQESDFRSGSGSGSHSLDWMRAMALRQWRHGDPVKDPVRNIHHAGEFLEKLLEEVGASGSIEEKHLQDAWTKVAGDFIAKNSKPESLNKGVLVLRVIQPALRFQLEQMKGKLLKNFKRELGEGVVKTIVLKV
jgi:predicted nucleic acid-binding Zn ribbon protein